MKWNSRNADHAWSNKKKSWLMDVDGPFCRECGKCDQMGDELEVDHIDGDSSHRPLTTYNFCAYHATKKRRRKSVGIDINIVLDVRVMVFASS